MRVSSVFVKEGDRKGGIEHPTRDLNEALSEHVDIFEVPITNRHNPNPAYWFRLGRRTRKKGDVVHVHFNYGSFGNFRHIGGIMYPFFAAGVGSTPMVVTIHNFQRFHPSIEGGGWRSVASFGVEILLSLTNKCILESTDQFVSLSKEEEEELLSAGLSNDNVSFIPLVSEPDPNFEHSSDCKQTLGVDGQQVVTAFGWVRRSKGYDRIIDVLPHLPDNTVFLIAGGTDGEDQKRYQEELKQQAHAKGVSDQVVFTGYVDRQQHSTVFNASDVIVLPYRDNRASDALGRALSYHLPCIASNNLEFRTFEQRWGCPATFADEDELCDLLNRVLSDEEFRSRLEANAEKFATSMNWDGVAERMVEIYRRAE